MPPKNHSSRMDDLLARVTADLLEGNPDQFEANTLRVGRIPLMMVCHDPVQPRRVLPESLRFSFHNNRLTPSQALRDLVHIVQVATRQRGRPFNNVLELLPNGDDDGEVEQVVALSPKCIVKCAAISPVSQEALWLEFTVSSRTALL